MTPPKAEFEIRVTPLGGPIIHGHGEPHGHDIAGHDFIEAGVKVYRALSYSLLKAESNQRR
jgi:hypothetical protein